MEAVSHQARHALAHGEEAHHHQSFLSRYVFSTDHKIIGIQYLATSFLMALLGTWLSLLFRVQLGWPDAQSMDPAKYYGLVTMHGTIMIFFVLTTALTGGFGNFLIPLQIGARDMAFPWLNMLSYWLFPPAIIVLLASFFVPGGPASAGWTAYPPLSALPQATPGSGLGQTLWLLSLFILMIAFMLGSINYITTILNLRAPGMSMGRLPLSIWAMFITAIISLLAFPVLMAAAIMLLFDRLAGTSFFLPAGLVVGGKLLPFEGGDPLLWQHLFWFLGHPEVYILILPAMGMVSEIIAANGRKPIFGYRHMVGSMLAIAGLSFIVWGHHMLTSGMNPYLGAAFMVTTLLIAVPSAVKTFNWLATLWGAKIRFTPAMLFAIGFVSLFVTGGLGGLVLGSEPVDLYLHDTYFVVGHFHVVMASASLFGIFAGIYHWFPKMFGKMLNATLGRIHFWLTLIGVYSIFFPMHYLGLHGMLRRTYDPVFYDFLKASQPVNEFISIAAFVTAAAQLIFLGNIIYSLARGQKADRNPWQATTLEWTAPSPPPHLNWGPTIPTVYRWAYDYSVPGAATDFIPQNVADAAEMVSATGAGGEGHGRRDHGDTRKAAGRD